MRARGFTLFEFSVCMALVALLAGCLLTKLAQVQRESEQVAVKALLGSVRTALAVRAVQAASVGGDAAVAALARENPFAWLAAKPNNYQGEYYRPRSGMIRDGHWYFDPSDKSINYLQTSDTFSLKTPKLLTFKVELLRGLDPNLSGGRTQAESGITLVQLAGGLASNNH